LKPFCAIHETTNEEKKLLLDLEKMDNVIQDLRKELREIRVETFMETTSTHDIALFVKVDNEETLKKYATNLLHVEVVKNYIKPFVYDRVCIDFFE